MWAILSATGLTALCWGLYGEVLHQGQQAMHESRLRPLICVGLAYFVIAVIVPALMLVRGEQGSWTFGGTLWSLAAGVAGAIGALGIILAFAFNGQPVFVMPLVFGCAPVVNTVLTMVLNKAWDKTNVIFLGALVLVVVGAATVLNTKPSPSSFKKTGQIDNKIIEIKQDKATGIRMVIKPVPPLKSAMTAGRILGAEGDLTKALAPLPKDVTIVAENESKLPPTELEYYRTLRYGTTFDQMMVVFFVACVALAWGVYGPVLHIGQSAMEGSKLRPLICVGLAYFLIAVLVPLGLLTLGSESGTGEWTWTGTQWSLAAGAAGAVGALGIILAFNAGGKPIYVMPLVFGGAPVINTATAIISRNLLDQIQPLFFVGLLLVVTGAVLVLIYAPRGGGKPGSAPGKAH